MSKKLIAKSILDGLTLAAAVIAGVCLWVGVAHADDQETICTDKTDGQTPPANWCATQGQGQAANCGNRNNTKCDKNRATCFCNVAGGNLNPYCVCKDKTYVPPE